ncbi:FKBP-type peptidyl-prolyl cis-trans isomerase [Microlunatus elymi]|nr:FKBP-type peptidyl-prolyl cis-trans isomerase [Microlunatus elymi]
MTSTPSDARQPRRAAKLLITAAVAASLALLGACSNDKPSTSNSPSASAKSTASASPSASPSPTIKPSTNLDGITVKGGFGTEPTVTFKHPWAINKTQSKVLDRTQKDGAKVQDDGTVTFDYVGIDGRTGKTFDSSFKKGGSPITYPLSNLVPGFKKGIAGKQVGDRVLVGMTSTDGYDSSGGNASAGIKVGDSLIFVIDVKATTLTSAEGKVNKPDPKLPTVVFAGDKPVVTIPKTDPPTKITTEELITGTGAAVKATDNVTTRSQTILWKNGKVVDNSWGTPFTPQLDQQTGTYSPTRNKAMQQAMVGHKVGSRLIMVFPPGTAYKYDDKSQGISKDDTVVMLVDILFTQAGQ